MPFTGSHPAAVLPFLRWLPPGALVVGSMAPDFPYFVPVGVTGATTHAALGVVTVDVLLAAAAWVLWRFLVWPAGLGLAPPLRGRGGAAAPGRPLLLAPAVALGAAPHVRGGTLTPRPT